MSNKLPSFGVAHSLALRVLRGFPFFAAAVTQPDVARPRSPARRSDLPLPMDELPDVACVPAPSRKALTGAG